MDQGEILVINAGSSSIKFAIFDCNLHQKLAGLAEIGPAGSLTLNGVTKVQPLLDHQAALRGIFASLAKNGIKPENLRAAAHRVVHGGADLINPTRLTPQVHAGIKACIPLAPLHNPHNLAAIDALTKLAPKLPQYVSFDTAFHADNPKVATRYALPDIPETKGIRRYGFHGLSYSALIEALPKLTGIPVPRRVLAFHLGNGASLCAILNGKSIATTMGFSPLDGLTMGTRTGGIGAGAVLKLVKDHGLDRTQELLHLESGLTGLSGGTSDMRGLIMDPSPEAVFAIEHFTYWSTRHAGSLIAAMQGLDAIVFTGGIGENASAVRAKILDGLRWVGVHANRQENRKNALCIHAMDSRVSVWIIPAEEEKKIARDALALIG